MEILDRKSEAIHFFFNGLEEMLDTINAALKHRTPHLNGEKFLTGKDVCRMLHGFAPHLAGMAHKGKNPISTAQRQDFIQTIGCIEMDRKQFFTCE